jgi:hypothetical protein
MFKHKVLTVAAAMALGLPPSLRLRAMPSWRRSASRFRIEGQLRDTHSGAEKRLKDAEVPQQRRSPPPASRSPQIKQANGRNGAGSCPTQPTSSNAFNPALSLILQGGYYNSTRTPTHAA